jgi:hypothetical protein
MWQNVDGATLDLDNIVKNELECCQIRFEFLKHTRNVLIGFLYNISEFINVSWLMLWLNCLYCSKHGEIQKLKLGDLGDWH